VSPQSHPGPKKRGKLTAQKARAIAESIAAGERHTAIAQRHGVSVVTVGAIKSGTRWADAIDDELRARMLAVEPSGAALDADGARGVMAALEAGRSGTSIAREFGISASMVSAIKGGKAWAQLDPELPTRLAALEQRGKKLTAEKVAEIKQLLAARQSARKVAAQYGVSASTVQSIAQGRTWGEVRARG
jgi:transposase-like protein